MFVQIMTILTLWGGKEKEEEKKTLAGGERWGLGD